VRKEGEGVIIKNNNKIILKIKKDFDKHGS